MGMGEKDSEKTRLGMAVSRSPPHLTMAGRVSYVPPGFFTGDPEPRAVTD